MLNLLFVALTYKMFCNFAPKYIFLKIEFNLNSN